MAGRAGAILPIALGVVLARWGGAVGAPRSSQRLRAAAIRRPARRPRGLRRTAATAAGAAARRLAARVENGDRWVSSRF